MAIFTKITGQRKGFASPLAFCLATLLGCYMVGCTKPEEDMVPRVDSLPTPMGPTGNIKEFSIQDSLVGYAHQTIIKWNVTETNTKTVVTLNGIKVALYGGLQSGPLYTNTNFTLMVNNGKTATKAIAVADSLSTYLWNDGQRWMPIDVLKDTIYVYKDQQLRDSLAHDFVSIFNRGRNAEMYGGQRVSFYLDHTSKEEQLSTSFPKPTPSGKYQPYPRVNPTDEMFMIWKNRYYWIESVSDKELVLRYDTLKAPGVTVTSRIQYAPEY